MLKALKSDSYKEPLGCILFLCGNGTSLHTSINSPGMQLAAAVNYIRSSFCSLLCLS